VSDCPVDRCVCHEVSFADLVRLHQRTGATFEELQRTTHAGTGCGLCQPYIKAALTTGRTRFPVLSHVELERFAAGG
jgi:NAD(P)H-nitrite reductase large subunit